MNANELMSIVRGYDDQRFAEHARLLERALNATAVKISGGKRTTTSGKLLEIFRVRCSIAKMMERETKALEALVDRFGAVMSETWDVFAVSGGQIDGAVYLSSSGRVGCFARDHGKTD